MSSSDNENYMSKVISSLKYIEQKQNLNIKTLEIQPKSKEILNTLNLINIPWTDILFPFVLSHLSWRDLFQLRLVSHNIKLMISEYFASLYTIDLSSVSNCFTTKAFEIVTENCKHIRYLNMPECKWLTDNQLLPIITNNPNLTYLDISRCFEITNECIKLLVTLCPKLRCLKLKECHWVTPIAVIHLAIQCDDLEDIDLTSCWEVTDESVIELVMRCCNLRRISLSKIYGITDRVLLALAYNCKSLESLNVSGCWRITDYGIRMVSEHCFKLQQVVVADCRDVSEHSLFYLRSKGVKVDVPTPSRNNLYLCGFTIEDNFT